MKKSAKEVFDIVLKYTFSVLLAFLLFGVVILDRISHAGFVSYLLSMTLGLMFLAAYLLRTKVFTAVLVVIMFVAVPSFYYNPYIKIKNLEKDQYKDASDHFSHLYFAEDEGIFLFVGEREDQSYKCFGSFKTNETECKRLGNKVFK